MSNPALTETTPREREVLALIGEGLTHIEIGERLGCSSRTVKVHSDSLRRKYGVKRARQLIAIAQEQAA